jgi:prefoldin subunit 5
MPPFCGNSSLQLILNQIFARLEGVGQSVDFSPVLAAIAAIPETDLHYIDSQLNLIYGDTETLVERPSGGGGTVDLSAVMAALADIQANTPTDLTTVLTLLNTINAKPSGGTVDLTPLQTTANTINTNTSGLSAQIMPIGTNVVALQTTVNSINSNTSGLSAQITPIGTNVVALQTTANSHTTQLNNLQTTANSINSNTSGLSAQITPIGANVTILQSTANTINSNTSGLAAQVTALQAKVDAIYLAHFPTPALELKFNTNTYSDAAGTVAGGLNALIMAWKDTIGNQLFVQPVAGAQRPTRVADGLSFNGANILQVLTPAAINWAAGNFTLEWYANQATVSSTPISISINAATYCGFMVTAHTVYLANAAGTGWAVAGLSLGALLANTWTHYAVVKEGGVLRTYRGGVQQATAVYTDTMYHLTTNYSYLGARKAATEYWTGKLTDFRIYNTCIYPGGQNFTPPTRST